MKHKCDHDNHVNDKYNSFHDNRHYIHNRKNIVPIVIIMMMMMVMIIIILLLLLIIIQLMMVKKGK